MADRDSVERTFIQHLDHIKAITAFVCRRNALRGSDAEDFASWVRLRLVEDDYLILRKFRGDSSLPTYLAVVIAMLFRDYRAQHWGRWRPSAAATSLGPVATRLETLVYRDGCTFNEAVEILHSTGETDLPDRELARLFTHLPVRRHPRPVEVGQEAIAGAPATERADGTLAEHELEHEHQSLMVALAHALDQLPVEDRLILRMRFWEALSVADVARALGLPQKSLYRRIERALATLRTELEHAGVSREQTAAIIGELSP